MPLGTWIILYVGINLILILSIHYSFMSPNIVYVLFMYTNMLQNNNYASYWNTWEQSLTIMLIDYLTNLFIFFADFHFYM